MKLFKTIALITGLTFALCTGAYAIEDDRYDEHPVVERFKICIGGFLIDSFDTTARFDSTRLPVGTFIDLEENFNLESN